MSLQKVMKSEGLAKCHQTLSSHRWGLGTRLVTWKLSGKMVLTVGNGIAYNFGLLKCCTDYCPWAIGDDRRWQVLPTLVHKMFIDSLVPRSQPSFLLLAVCTENDGQKVD